MAKNRFPGLGGGFNINQLQKQAKKMQEEIEKLQEELNQREVEATAGGGAVKVVINGKKEIKSIEISPEVVDPDDIETLQDLIVACVNEAIRKVEKMIEEEMQKVAGFGFPGLF
ncbi:YbaB/EbfC family nucleoid-associated protein [Caldicellulosiruptor changbaiensis]|uniref:Nucleoid-associated protein ELD05_08465 n=1 Tax=Caldicellulosiruptor changbaiensis TaxID=1222016 RepID=A0A3T0D6H0_9FIRM|nr:MULTISPECIES: YbaB/EbfC family nucleoid-associated protein [Caldicellulosiruptor]AZT90675.1 YbaB/EbfC family nucleoid-associated protein [Caldicellulosiruptor changbaiensis]